RDSRDRFVDYERGITVFGEVASYLASNISSRNTPGLRDLQASEQLTVLLERCAAARAGLRAPVPIFLKLSPDLDDEELDAICTVLATCPLDGVIVSNTTIDRSGLTDRHHANESG